MSANETRPTGGCRTGSRLCGDQTGGDVAILCVRADDLTQTQLRAIQDAMTEGEAATWERTADRFRWAMSREGDYPGALPKGERLDRDARLAASALACSRHARILRDRNGGASWDCG